LPRLVTNKAFLAGLSVTVAFRLVRALPVIFGAQQPWSITLPLQAATAETALEHLYLQNVGINWSAIGFAYLVPADVSLSIWFFYALAHLELLAAAGMGSPLHANGRTSELLQWQATGAYFVFTLGALFMARRHLVDVVRKAVGLGRHIDDSEEPVGYGASFWGFVICSAGVVWWMARHGMQAWVAVALLALWLCFMFVSARLVAQSGVFLTETRVYPARVLHGLGLGQVFGPAGAVLARMQDAWLIGHNAATLSPQAINAFRISEVFGKRRKLLLPALAVALGLAVVSSTWVSVGQAYKTGALNFSYTWGVTANAKSAFDAAHQGLIQAGQYQPARWAPLAGGGVLMAFVMFMRARFYWWPVHPIGLLTNLGVHSDWLALGFFLGWLTKVSLTKFGSGRMVRQARFFFIALILVELSTSAFSSVVRAISRGTIPAF
ncbi:MAG: DUF6785 family protein, partial [Planctomycetota bacterium]